VTPFEFGLPVIALAIAVVGIVLIRRSARRLEDRDHSE